MSKQNPTKTAKQISKTDFYFVTCFYRLDDICMADMKACYIDIGKVLSHFFASLTFYL